MTDPVRREKCRKGHVLTPENSYYYADGRVGCKVCKRLQSSQQTQAAARKRAAKEKRVVDLAKDADRKRRINPESERAELQKVALALKELERRKRERRLDFYEPYPKQLEFHTLGKTKHEIALIASNRSGKTYSAAAEVAMHLTGLYPPNWPGKRFDHPIRMWSCGVTGLVVRDVNQKLLFGTPGVEMDQGTGMVPKECVDWKNGVSTSRGYSDAFDTVQVKHVSGGISTVAFKSYEQGRAKFQAETLDLIHCDEEPPIDIYSECIVRLATTGGLMLCTFTPLEGMSAVVIRYLQEPSPDRAFINMTIDDALHFSDEERIRIVAAYPAHEREARAKGIPMLGSGAIFQVSDESITEDSIAVVPEHWAKGIGLDFGIDHPFAGVLMAWDRDADCIHIIKCVKMKDARAVDHSVAMKPWGAVRAFWPHDGSTRDKGSGETLASIYKSHGVKMYQTHASFPDGSISTEAGIMEMQERMTTGRFKVGRDLVDWFVEKRMYHRKDGMIVKQNDDLLSATRVGMMMKRYWKGGFVGDAERMAKQGAMCRDVEFPIFGV